MTYVIAGAGIGVLVHLIRRRRKPHTDPMLSMVRAMVMGGAQRDIRDRWRGRP